MKSEAMRFLKRAARQGSWPLLQRYMVYPRILDLPPVQCRKSADFAVHVLICERDATMLHWCLRSLLKHASSDFMLYIHDDGSCRPETLARFRAKFVDAVVFSRSEASLLVESCTAAFPDLQKWRNEDYIALKCIDFYLVGNERWIILLDPDVLFFSDPKELFDSLHADVWMRDCFYSPYIDPDESMKLFGCKPKQVSGGLGRVRRESRDFALLQAINRFKELPHIQERARHRGLPKFEDQTYHAVLTARANESFFLGSEYQVATELGLQDIVAKHYTTPARFWLFEEGIPRIAQQLEIPLPRWLRDRA